MPKRKILPDNEIISMYLNLHSIKEIATKFNIGLSTVTRRLKENNVKTRSISEEQKLSFKRGRKPTKYWQGKKHSPEFIEKRVSKIRGKNHYLWSGGKSIRNYRKGIIKKECELCESKEKLLVHHKDFDHYNDVKSNLQVLCLSCHSSIHKKEYWRCKRDGIEYKSNAKNNWEKNGKKKNKSQSGV